MMTVSLCLCVCVFVCLDVFSRQHCSYSGDWCFGVGGCGSCGVCGLVQEKEGM